MQSDIFTSLSFIWRGFFRFILIRFSNLSSCCDLYSTQIVKKRNHKTTTIFWAAAVGTYVALGAQCYYWVLTKLISVAIKTWSKLSGECLWQQFKKIKIFVVEKYQFLYKFLSLIVSKDTIFYNLPAAIQSWHRHITVFLFCLHQRDFEWNQPGLE